MRDTESTNSLLAGPTADQLLLARLKSGDEQALADLSDAYSSKIYQLAFRYLRNKEDAEEITQDVLFKVYRKVDAFRGDAQLSSWIYRITFNAAMSRLRTARYQRTVARRRQRKRMERPQPVRPTSPTGATWRTNACSARSSGSGSSARSSRFRRSTVLL
jgi:RNA polymerase sigma factor (sigma-70 family)